MRQETDNIIIDWEHNEGWEYMDICDCCGSQGNRGRFMELTVNDVEIVARICIDQLPSYTIYDHTTQDEYYDLTREELEHYLKYSSLPY